MALAALCARSNMFLCQVCLSNILKGRRVVGGMQPGALLRYVSCYSMWWSRFYLDLYDWPVLCNCMSPGFSGDKLDGICCINFVIYL